MAKLTAGGGPVPKGWSVPSPVYVRSWFGGRYKTGGMVWLGKKPPTTDDIRALRAAFGDDVTIDAGTLVGQDDTSYNSFYDRHKQTRKVRLW